MTKVAVLGSGSWGTAFANVVADAGVAEVTLWARRAEVAEAIGREHANPEYFPGIGLNPRLAATTDAAAAVEGAGFVVVAVPSQTLRANLTAWRPHIPRDAVIVSLMKGIELGTSRRMSEVIVETLELPADQVAVVSGPNLAREIAERQPATAVVASPHEATAVRLQEICRAPYFRPYTNTDMIGVELGGAVKNVIALAVGVAVGMGFGDNAKASLITRGLAETVRLAVALGADEHTLAGLAGMGDLVATCSSPLSRNRTFGERLGAGRTLSEVIAETSQTAEGVKSSESVLALARANGVDMPITEAVVAMMHGDLPPAEALLGFMARSAKPERYGV
ncbi:NAD(P)H-dependent glycerol-3-phosphate dehydrogenase [Marinitenerispora sediminis]|uniref:Glycerol-3-phosphate dehydrogenase [NAD(P)+] n=1 Tax=Marinitenerispora sediminis TaxID=1931232 RepID=A0A368TBL8_9ACTN|nr:NAD(P)H-dependent glycerol-3-phosphate dehydrogenase [Marinitenerispora sediminis]RCV54025.1 glycerol-3-phosphate dehydrogenase [Marinitenerispora sediminis]RCV60824.1 glycerol-3-phosphate dehydrogenase [Marinitenerispora sediminis]RCV62455.1 glycerol-3-phosphate dehydrogenase [Marinitenerispora sediminis]